MSALLTNTTFEPRSDKEMAEASDAWKKLFCTYEEQLDRGCVSVNGETGHPTTREEKFHAFKKTDAYLNDFKPLFPDYRGALTHRFFKLSDIIFDILHAKIHFADITFSFMAPLLQILEDTTPGQAIHQYVSAMSEKGLRHKANMIKEECS